DFAPGAPLVTTGLLDAVVYGPEDVPDVGLLALLGPDQLQVDENGLSMVEAHSLQRCPNGAGGFRETETYRPDLPTPGSANGCAVDLPPAIIAIAPASGETGVSRS